MPWFAVLVAVVAFAFLVLPLVGLRAAGAVGQPADDLPTPEATAALRLSIVCSLWATFFAVVLGVPLAWVLARVTLPRAARWCGRSRCCPMVVPPVVGGVGLFYAFGRDGLVGQYLSDWFGVQLTFSTAGAVMAETFVAMPFLVVTVEAALRSVDRRYEDAAATLGAGRFEVFRRVTLPLIRPGLDRRAPRSRGRARSASSAPRSPSPATSRAGPRRCRSRCTSCSSRTRRSRSG